MFNKSYKNFVKASSAESCPVNKKNESILSGEEARRLYLEEVKDARSIRAKTSNQQAAVRRKKLSQEEDEVPISNKDLFLTIQNNDVDKLKCTLDKFPDKITVIDDYGWSLLMIACQANSIDCVRELLLRGVDLSVRDKAGNSARSLVIKNKNYAIAEILLNSIKTVNKQTSKNYINSPRTITTTAEYKCDVCNQLFPDKEEHLSSTLHNISASKGKKMPANYVIPPSNKGYQLMVKHGWDRDSGLGRDGSGKKYPIKTVQKKDRHGLGHGNRKVNDRPSTDNIKQKCKITFAQDSKNNRQFEINFRREFY